MRIVAVVQARMSSSRFPGKALAPLAGVPLIEVVCRRARSCAALDGLVVATSDRPDDDPLAAAVEALGVSLYRGSLHDVLARVVDAARQEGAEAVVRITGDCPLVDPEVLAEMIRRFREGGLAYLSNVSPPSFPNGLDLEIVRLDALEAALDEATEGYQREHVTPFVRERAGRFPQGNFRREGESLYHLHWSIDRPEHLQAVEQLWLETGVEEPLLLDLLAALERRPDLASEQHPERNHAGAIRSFLAEAEATHPLPLSTESDTLRHRAKRLGLVTEPAPYRRVLVRGKGSRVWDADGNELLDLSADLAFVPLGHAHPRVLEAGTRQLEAGAPSGDRHPLAIELTARVCRQIEWAEWAVFGTGVDTLQTCFAQARGHTARRRIARETDLGREPTESGNEDTVHFPPGDLEALEALLTRGDSPLTAVVLEPIPAVPRDPELLEGTRELVGRHGAFLAFDERTSGFRPAPGGARRVVGFAPDLCLLGRSLANGLPLSLVVGRGDPPAPSEGTEGGCEASSLAAALVCLDQMETEDFWGQVPPRGDTLRKGYRRAAESFGLDEVTACVGPAFQPTVIFREVPGTSTRTPTTGPMLAALFHQEMLRHGILWSPLQPLTLAHDDRDIERIVEAYGEVLRVLKFALELDAVAEMTLGIER